MTPHARKFSCLPDNNELSGEVLHQSRLPEARHAKVAR